MKRWIKRLFCFHLHWNADPFPPGYREWYQREWECVRCGKRVIKESNWLPLNYVK